MAVLIRARNRALLSLMVAAGLMLSATAPVSGSATPNEQQVEAAYLFNFARYVDWPGSAFDGATAPLRICVLGDDEFVTVARTSVGDRKVAERPVTVEGRSSVSASRSCHILFIAASSRDVESEVISDLGSKSVFTVSDSEGFAEQGGVANFVRVGNKIRFEINRDAANKAGLKVSSRLLRLANVVE